VIARVSDKEVVRRINRNIEGCVQTGARRGSSIAAKCPHTVAREGRDGTGGVHAANPVVAQISDEEISGAI
jgi:hypothetical protein